MDLTGTMSDTPQDLIKDSNEASFMADVMEASMNQPVLVDFWAPWCGPCKQLTPILEQAVRAAGGKVKLVKVNIDENQGIAQQLRVQSIPMVYAFVQGRPVDVLQGAVPESQIKAFIDKIAASMADPMDEQLEAVLAQAKAAMEAQDYPQAMQVFGAILQQDPNHLDATAGIIECYIGIGDTDRAQQMIEMLPEEMLKEPALASVKTSLDLLAQTSDLGSSEELITKIEANPQDWQAHFDLALLMNAQGNRSKAAEHLITIIKQDREWRDDEARKQLLLFFDAWGATDSDTIAGRRALSSILFS